MSRDRFGPNQAPNPVLNQVQNLVQNQVLALLVVLLLVLVVVWPAAACLVGLVVATGVGIHSRRDTVYGGARIKTRRSARPLVSCTVDITQLASESARGSLFTMDDFEKEPGVTEHSSPQKFAIVQEIQLFKKISPGARRVADLTAHVGVDTTVLAHAFPDAKITAVERHSGIAARLHRNMATMGISDRVTTVTGDAVKWMATASADFDLIYVDPPWGGKSYKKSAKATFGLSDLSLGEVAKRALKLAPVVVFKVPYNYDMRVFDGVGAVELAEIVTGNCNVGDLVPVSFYMVVIRRLPRD